MKKPAKKVFSISLSLLVGAVLLGGVFYYVGWRDIFEEIGSLHVVGILALAGNVFLTSIMWIVGWWVILRGYGIVIPFHRVIGARLSGFAVSYITPSLYFGGEPVRALIAADSSSAPITRIFATIVVERFLGGLSLVFFILIGGFFAFISPQVTHVEKQAVLIGVPFISFWIIVGLIDFAGNFKWISRIIRLLGRIFRRWRGGLERAANKVAETEDEVYTAFTKHWRATLLSLLIQLLANLLVYIRPLIFFFFSSHTTFTFPELSLVFTLSIIMSTVLWITPGGLGTGEAALIGIFALVGIAKDEAVAFSLSYKFFELLVVAIGLFYLFHKGIGRMWHRVRSSSRHSQ
ncbi:MAG TPA: flippase-like domain-containing protein [Candidatus Acetothermia bacterium]|nr:flippase-like domain-containing protein [Candidatus Acetothermia bacterium]